jgi:hypothetical protein
MLIGRRSGHHTRSRAKPIDIGAHEAALSQTLIAPKRTPQSARNSPIVLNIRIDRDHPLGLLFTHKSPFRAPRMGQDKARCAGNGQVLVKRRNAVMAHPGGST